MTGQLDQYALEVAIRADEKAKGAHERIDRSDTAIAELSTGVSALNVAVAKLNVKVGLAAGFGSLLGGGVIAAVLKLLP